MRLSDLFLTSDAFQPLAPHLDLFFAQAFSQVFPLSP